MRHLGLPALLAVTACVCGCTMIPAYHRPALPVPPTWPESAAPSASGPSVAETRWQDFFADRRLAAVIELALVNNRDLRVAALNVERVQAVYRIQRSYLFPSFGVLAAASKVRVPEDSSDGDGAETRTEYAVNAGFTGWEVDLFGRLRSLKKGALEQYLATRAARRAAQSSLVAAVASNYLALAADREALELAQATLAAQQSSFELLRRSRELGIASDLDLRQVQTQVEAARVAVAQFRGQIASDRNQLDVLAGTPVPPELLPDRLNAVSESQPLSPGLPSIVLLSRPDVAAAEHRLLAANADIGAARAAFFPRISLTAALGTVSSELGALFSSGTRTWSFAPQVAAPLWAGGLQRANLGSAKAERAIAVAQYEGAIQRAFAEVSDALALRTTLQEQREAQQALVDALAETHRLSDARYKAGIDSYLAVLVAQRALFGGQQALIGIRLSEQLNQVALYEALGGGV